MSQQPPADPQRQKRRSLYQRQTLIIGALVAILLVFGLFNLAIWAGILPAPYTREFSSEPEDSTPGEVVPCPTDGAEPVELSEITANVFNGTTQGGLADETANTLAETGVQINSESNWAEGEFDGGVMILTGADGVDEAYTVARMFPDAAVGLDDRNDATIDVVLGAAYLEITTDDDAAAFDPDEPIVAPEGCEPVES